MHNKINALLHMAAAAVIFFLTDSFCSEVIGMVFRICDSVFFILALYICLDILSVWTAVFLYAKYVLRVRLSKIYLGKPFPALRYCIAAIAVPFMIDIISFIFTKGQFNIGCHTQDDLVYLLFHEFFSTGFRIAVTEGIIFRGMLFHILQKGFGNKAGILISSFFYAAVSYIFYNRFAWNGFDNLGTLLLTFLMGLAFALITLETGSIWYSVVIHFWYNALSGSAYILHIDTRQDFPAIFTYTIKSRGTFVTDIPMPSIAVFLVLMIVARMHMKKEAVL